MLETAIAEWSSPILIHTILTGATALQFDSFIKRVKRNLDQAGIKFRYRGCTETATDRGGLHRHYMWTIDADDSRNSPFDDGNDTSAISRATTATQRIAPDFEVTVAQPRRHDTPYIALTPYTLQDAACWLSYIYKVRSKLPGHKYMSSRKQCVQHRQQAQRLGKPDSVSTQTKNKLCMARSQPQAFNPSCSYTQWHGTRQAVRQSESWQHRPQPTSLAVLPALH